MLDISNYIFIGKISRSIGTKGFVKILPLTDYPERFFELEYVYLYDADSDKIFSNALDGTNKFKLQVIEILRDYIRIKFEGIDAKNSSDKLTNLFIVIEEEKRLKLENGLFYKDELCGLEVDFNNIVIGKIDSIECYGGDDLLKVYHYNTEKYFYIPYRNEFVKKVDIDAKKIYVELIEGMID